ncbi:CREG family protein [Neisseriaceae bacterium JH1-16]|nr:CREG family protein [Neisseriaceae bacterium JH1-16]
MKLPPHSAIELLHRAAHGALATHSVQLPGYPFATLLPFVPDERHRPLFLISRLAEHTRNLGADPRASLLLAEPGVDEVLSATRLTVVGDVLPIDADEALIARYLRYQPEAAGYLALGDFVFYRLEPQQLRLIAGFGRMGWLTGEELTQTAPLAPEQEVAELAELAALRPAARWLGVDAYGADLEEQGKRLRLVFAAPALDAGARRQAVAAALMARPS